MDRKRKEETQTTSLDKEIVIVRTPDMNVKL
jgi:hypothetical protein